MSKARKSKFRKIDQRHIFDGGTLITNFSNDKRESFKEAIARFEQRFGNSGLEICEIATCAYGSQLHDCCSLHNRSGEFPENMTEFWAIHAKLRDAASIAKND